MSLSQSLRIAKHEWRLVLREPRFLAPFLLTPLLLIGIQAFNLYFRPAGSEGEALILARSLLLMLAALAPSAVVPMGADTFAGEKERNTLEILLCVPVETGALFWGKVLGVFPLPVLIGWLGQTLMLIMLAERGLMMPGFGEDAAKAMLLTPCLGLFLASVATLMSLRSESVRGAAQITSLFMLAAFFAVISAGNFIFASWAHFAVFATILLSATVTCLLLARARFRRVL